MGVLTLKLSKPSLDLVCRPTISRIVDSCFGAGVENIFVTSHHNLGTTQIMMDYDAFFSQKEKLWFENIHHIIENPLLETAHATKLIACPPGKEDRFYSRMPFRKTEPFFVTAADVSMPNIDLADFAASFTRAKRKNPQLLGAICFLLRPFEDLIKTAPSAVVDNNDLLISFEEPPEDRKEASRIFKRITSQKILDLSAKVGRPLLPVNSCIYIFNRKIFDAVSPPDDKNLYDWGKWVFKHVPSRSLLAYFAPERLIDRPGERFPVIMREFSNMNDPSSYWAAQFQYLLSLKNIGRLEGDYRQDMNSFINRGAEIEGKVTNSVIGLHTHIGEGTKVENSIIGNYAQLYDVHVKDSVLMPYVYVNLRGDSPPLRLIDSCVICGNIDGGSFIGSAETGSRSIRRLAATTNDDRTFVSQDLSMGKEDEDLPEEAFRHISTLSNIHGGDQDDR